LESAALLNFSRLSSGFYKSTILRNSGIFSRFFATTNMPMNQPLRVCDLGEQGLLQRVQAFCPAAVIGDDAALLSVAPGHSLVVSSDTLVDGVHFSLGLATSIQTTSPEDAGWRSAAANLSDLAAMGASPIGITVALGLPGDIPVDWVEQIYQGMTACLSTSATPIVGGDICRSPVLTISITALGQVLPAQAIRRSTARLGDAILVTGIHGASRAGLELLLHPEAGHTLSQTDRAALIRAHQRPVPRLDVIPVLQSACSDQRIWIDWPIAGMDSSDGLADAVLQICRASRVGARLEASQIPLPSGLTQWVSEAQALEWVLYGGEDFELVLCLPLELAQAVLRELDGSAAIVGEIRAEPDVILHDRTEAYPEQQLSLTQGFQHFASQPSRPNAV
jgi:thiamine-monophosphate kinase